MKKILSVAIAAVLAIGFSAFTSGEKQLANYYLPRGAGWDVITEEQACPVGEDTPCVVDNPITPTFDPTTVYTMPILDDQYILEKDN